MSSTQFTDILFVSPHKYDIKVRVTYESKHTLGFIRIVIINFILKNFLSLTKTGFKFFTVKVKVNISESLFKRCSDKLLKTCIVNRHKESVENSLEVPVNFLNFGVNNANKRAGKCFYC